MHTYLIYYKVATLAELYEPFDYRGYKFVSYDSEPWKNDAWVASRTIKAPNGAMALNKFITELIPLVAQFSTISQCSFRLFANTYIIFKQDKNEEKRFFIFFVRHTEPVGLHFNKEEIKQLEKSEKIPNKEGLFFVMEAANATTFYARLAMLVMAVEGLAGEVLVGKNYFTNHEITKEILGSELENKLYKKNEGLRNKLFHGIIRDHS